jgi:hypothetical protein
VSEPAERGREIGLSFAHRDAMVGGDGLEPPTLSV